MSSLITHLLKPPSIRNLKALYYILVSKKLQNLFLAVNQHMKISQYVYDLFPLINHKVNLIIFIIRLSNTIPCQLFIFIQFITLEEQTETVNYLLKSSYHINCSFWRLQFKSDVVCLILLFSAILHHYYYFHMP